MKNMEKNTKKGFTLLELMVTVGLLVFAIAGIFSSFIGAVLLNDANANLVKAANDAQYVLEQIKGVAYSQLSSYTAPVLANLENENITVQKNIAWRIAEVTAHVSWTEHNRNRSFSLTTRIAR